jgi:hypothetical protein
MPLSAALFDSGLASSSVIRARPARALSDDSFVLASAMPSLLPRLASDVAASVTGPVRKPPPPP